MNGYVTTCLEMVRNAAPVVAEAPPLKGTPPSFSRGRSEGIECLVFQGILAEGAKHPLPSPFGLQGGPPPLGVT